MRPSENRRRIALYGPILAVSLVFVVPTPAQTWVGSVRGALADQPASIARMADGDFVVAGATTSSGAGGLDGLLLRIDPCGGLVWQYTFGGGGDDLFAAVTATADGGILAVGDSDSFGDGQDWWMVRLDGTGDLIWQRRYGAGGIDAASGVTRLADGGFAVSGTVERTTTPDSRSFDGAIVALDDDGAIQWSHVLGGDGTDELRGIAQATDGGIVVAGYREVSIAASFDAWVVRLARDGSVVWQATYGSFGDDMAEAVAAFGTGLVVVGTTDSDEARLADHWVAALDSLGDVAWQRRFGGADDDRAAGVVPTIDGGVLVAGDLVAPQDGSVHALLSRLAGSGVPVWHRVVGLDADRDAVTIAASRNGFVVAGVDASAGNDDIWLLRTESEGTLGALATCAPGSGPGDVLGASTQFARAGAGGGSAFVFDTHPTVASRQPATFVFSLDCPVFPGEVSPTGAPPLRFETRSTLVWEPAELSCAESFNLYEGLVQDLAAGAGATCRNGSLATAQASIPEAPVAGHARYYLVTGRTPGGEGTPGRATNGVARTLDAPCPP